LISQHLQNWLNYDDEMNEKKYEKGIEYEKLIKSINDSNLSSYLSNYNNYHFYYPKFNHTGLDFYNETLYSGIKKDGKITQYNKLKILKMKNTDLENYFGDSSRNHDNLLIYKSDKKLYMELNNIFNENSKDKKINAFVRYMQEKYPIRKDFIEVEKNQATGYNPGKISKKIYSLKYTKTINANVFEKKPSSKSIKNRISFYASLKPKKIMHYLGYDKNKKEIHVCIPINIYFSKFTKNKLGIRIFKLNYKNIYEELKLYKKIVYFKNKSDQFEKVMIINENNGDDDTNYMKYCNNLFVERICFGEKYELKKEYKNTTIAGISSCSNIFYVDGISNNKIEIKAIDRIKVIDRIIIRHQIIANTFFMKFEKIRVYHHICI
jgi:hypothetical protein